MPNFEGAIKRWDIAVVPFPYTDTRAEKRRPALVVSGESFMRETGLVWVMMITTSREDWPHDVKIEDHAACGLPAPSKIRCAKIATIEASRVLRVAGSLGQDERMKVKENLAGILG